MAVGGLRSAPKTEPCGLCTVPVEVTGRTARGRYSGSPLCDHCAGRTDRVAYFGTFELSPKSPRRVLARSDRWLDEWVPRTWVQRTADEYLRWGHLPVSIDDRSAWARAAPVFAALRYDGYESHYESRAVDCGCAACDPRDVCECGLMVDRYDGRCVHETGRSESRGWEVRSADASWALS